MLFIQLICKLTALFVFVWLKIEKDRIAQRLKISLFYQVVSASGAWPVSFEPWQKALFVELMLAFKHKSLTFSHLLAYGALIWYYFFLNLIYFFLTETSYSIILGRIYDNHVRNSIIFIGIYGTDSLWTSLPYSFK